PQREIAILDPGQQPDAMLVPDRLRLIPADLAGPNTAGLAQPPHPVDRGAHPHPKLCRSLMAGKAITLNRRNHTFTKVKRISAGHRMLAPIPASILNQNQTDLGIPNRFGIKSSRFSFPGSRQRPQVPDRPTRRQRLRRRDDRLGVDAVVTIEIGDRAGLAKMLDTERAYAVAGDGAKPGERRRMTIEHGDDGAMGRQLLEQPLDMGACMHQAALARPLRRGPAGIEAVGGSHRGQPDVTAGPPPPPRPPGPRPPGG